MGNTNQGNPNATENPDQRKNPNAQNDQSRPQ